MQLNKITIHCSDTYADQLCNAEIIDEWHKEFGWSGIGYHFVILRSGDVEIGRPLKFMGAHVKGHNEGNIGICLCGGKSSYGAPVDNFTVEQKRAAKNLVNVLREIYGIDDVKPHNYYDKGKTCPNFDIEEIL